MDENRSNMIKKEKSSNVRIHENLKNRIKNFQKDFKNINGFNVSTTIATKIIDEKIEKFGGILVPKIKM